MNDRVRAWASFGVIAAFTLMLAATSKPKSGSSGSSGTTGTSGSSGASGTAESTNRIPADIDLVLVTTSTGCDKKLTSPGCKLLRDFDQADTYVDFPVTKIVWFGESYGLGGAGDAAKEPFFVNVEKGAAGFAGAARTLIPENPKEKKDSDTLLAATKAGHSVPNSEAAKFMLDAKPPGGLLTIVKTKGRSHALSEIPTKVYVRRLGDRLLILEYTGSPIGHDRAGGVAATAWIAETWPLK
jgi:hypothetical protein